ncbi:MAG TPA: hypothetical protein VE987_04070 [Polyangiaceae bacterium]|nr:hypothetical protein [Polyangiaceae bacterium]
MTSSSIRAAAGLSIVVAALAACHGAPFVQRAIVCADTCCSGDPAAVDCAENPNLACVQPDDACPGALAYGCVDGSFYSAASPACSGSDASDEIDLEGDGANVIVFFDGSTIGDAGGGDR